MVRTAGDLDEEGQDGFGPFARVKAQAKRVSMATA